MSASLARDCLEAMSSWACACVAARHESPCRLEKLVVVCACLDELRELSPTGGGSATCIDLTGRPQGSDMLSGRSWWRRGKGFFSCPCPCAARFDRAECWRAPKMQKESAARPQKRVLQEADSQAGRMHAHRCPTPSLWRLSARARGPAPAYLVKSRILECRAAADAPTAPPRSPPHNAGTASQTCPLSPPTARVDRTVNPCAQHQTQDWLPSVQTLPNQE